MKLIAKRGFLVGVALWRLNLYLMQFEAILERGLERIRGFLSGTPKELFAFRECLEDVLLERMREQVEDLKDVLGEKYWNIDIASQLVGVGSRRFFKLTLENYDDLGLVKQELIKLKDL